jgi:nitrogen fixation protein FixH
MIREFTGRHMWFVMIGMFGTIIAVNLVMARYAVGTFGGTVVDNSYVASQDYNRWLADARAQKALGWTLVPRRNDDGRVEVDGTPLAGVLTGTAHHPLGRAPDQSLRFTRTAPGKWVSDGPLPAGRWMLRLTLVSDGKTARYALEIPA